MSFKDWFSIRFTAAQYLIFQSVGSVFVNGGANAGFALGFRDTPVVPLWGRSSIAFDTVLSAFLLSALTVLIGSLFVRNDMRSGRVPPLDWRRADRKVLRWFPHNIWTRALIFGPLFTLAVVPLTLGGLALAGFDGLSYPAFFVFKVTFASVLGMVVTPINALYVITERANRPAPAAGWQARG